MKRISFWAKYHKTQAQLAIVISFIFLNILGFATGYFLNQVGIVFLPEFQVGCYLFLLVALILYPMQKQKGRKFNFSTYYHLQKSCDFVLAATTFCMIVYLGNRPENLIQFYPALKAFTVTVHPKDSTVKHYKSVADFSSSMVDGQGTLLKWKERRKLLKEQVKAIKKDNSISKGGKIALIILSVLAAAGLLFLVAGLSCSLSCSGLDLLAIVVGTVGTVGVVLLLLWALKAINGKKKSGKLATENSETDHK